MKKILFLIGLTLLFISCHKDDKEEDTPRRKTVLIYMSAENNLTYESERDLDEIREGSMELTDNDNLLVFYDASKKNELPWLARIVKGHLKDSVSVVDMQISNKDDYASDPYVFEKVLSYAYSNYPATEGYGLTLWGHAKGWMKQDSIAYSRGYGIDNGTNSPISNSGPWLNIPTLRKILEKQPHLAYIFADCCNFMCLETLYELREVTDYIVGSPAEIPGVGAPYETVVPEMFKRQNAAIGMMTKYAELFPDFLPLSVAKTKEMDAVAKATRTVLKAIYSRMDTEYPDMNGLIHYFNESSSRFLAYLNIFYDAGDFVRKYATEAEYAQWKQVFDRMIIDKAIATKWETNKSWVTYYSDFEVTEAKYHGVSMYVPEDPRLGYHKKYNEDIKQLGWYWVTMN